MSWMMSSQEVRTLFAKFTYMYLIDTFFYVKMAQVN